MQGKLIKALRGHIEKSVNCGDMPPWMGQDIEDIIISNSDIDLKGLGDANNIKMFAVGLLGQLIKEVDGQKVCCEYNIAIEDAIETILFNCPLIIPTNSHINTCSCGSTKAFHGIHGHLQCDSCGKPMCSHTDKESK